MSLSDTWCTPSWLAALLGEFDLDPCSNPHSHVTSTRKLSLEAGNDGLVDPWAGSVFVNPPYSNPLPWAQRLLFHTKPWAALVKLDPTTQWWRVLTDGATWAAFRRRLKFDRHDKAPLSANFPSALVWGRGWHPSADLRAHLWMQ